MIFLSALKFNMKMKTIVKGISVKTAEFNLVKSCFNFLLHSHSIKKKLNILLNTGYIHVKDCDVLIMNLQNPSPKAGSSIILFF